MMTIKAFLTMASAAVVIPASASQRTYPTPEAAANALVEGIQQNDKEAIAAAVGSDWRKYIPTGSVDKDDVKNFLDAWSEKHSILQLTPDKAYLSAGQYGWTLPIPIVKAGDGWLFDTRAAPEEMRVRRIGRNELAAIQVSLAYSDAQQDYIAHDWDHDGVHQFATRGISSPGKRDGLYWPTLPGEPESPAGAEFAEAKRGQPFHGYEYRILTRQGADAPGGARNYVENGHMTDGYALVAWPAKYDDTGVMTFIVNQDGVVYQKNLGPDTDAQVRKITAFNPDASWQKVTPQQ